MKKLVFGGGAAAILLAGLSAMGLADCGWSGSCPAEAGGTADVYALNTVRTVEGLPEPLTDIQLLSAPLAMEGSLPNPRAQLLLPVPPVMQEGILSSLQGAWYSAQDARDQFTVEGTSRLSLYAGIAAEQERIDISWRCGSYAGGGSYLRAQAEGGEELCYSIESLGGDELVLTYMPTGEMLRFLKMQ